MATKIGDLYFEVTADSASVRRELDSLGGAASDAAKLIGNALVDAFAVATAAAAAAAIGITFQIAKIGSSFNAAEQRANALFTALTGSLDTSIELISEFNQLSLDSPIFNPAQLQRTTSLLLTFGIAADDAFELAQNINVAAIALDRGQTGATALARAIGQIQGRGFLEGDEARQLSEVGVNAYAVIAEATGRTTAETIELGRQQKLLAEDVVPILSAALENTFGPVGQQLLETYGTQVQGLGNIFTGLSSSLVQPFIGATGGGVIVEFLGGIREELMSVVVAAEDGTFRLTGALEGLNDLSVALSEAFEEVGDSLTNALSGALSGGGVSAAASRLAEIIPDLLDAAQEFGSGALSFFSDMKDAIAPILPPLGRTLEILYDFAQDALPILADILVDVTAAAAPVAAEFLEIANGILEVASPVIIELLAAVADAISLISEAVIVLAPYIDDLIAGFVAFKVAIIAVEVATASYVTVTLAPMIAAFIKLAAVAGLAVTAIAGIKSVVRGIQGDIDFLSEDVSIFEKPFQLAGRFGFWLGGGDREQQQFLSNTDRAKEAADNFNFSLLKGIDTVEEARVVIDQYGASLGVSAEAADFFGNIVQNTWTRLHAGETAFNDVAASLEGATARVQELVLGWKDSITFGGEAADVIEEEVIPILGILQREADDAWEALNRLANINPASGIDDFLRDLPSIGEKLTDALSVGGQLGQLELSGIRDELREKIVKVIQEAAKDGGKSLEDIRALFDERGLVEVIRELGLATIETTKTVDPLVRKYAALNAEAGDLRDAISALNDERSTRIRAEIDQLEAALRDATDAADDAREALVSFLTGGYSGSQAAVDDLIGNIDSLGSRIEEGLLAGGTLGGAQVRSALGDFNTAIADIVRLGVEEGLTGAQITALLGPLASGLGEVTTAGLNRISSLDWTEGITPQAAAELQATLSRALGSAGEIDLRIGNIIGADARVKSLEAAIKAKQLELNTEVTFSAAQVQSKLNELNPIIEIDPLVSDEAVRLLFNDIETILNDDDLALAVDEANLVQQILDAARDAEDSISLTFTSGLEFNRELLLAAAANVSEELFRAIRARLQDIGAEEFFETPGGYRVPLTAPTAVGSSGSTVTLTTNVNNDIKVTETQSPLRTASEIISASSAAAGSGGRYDPSRWYTGPR